MSQPDINLSPTREGLESEARQHLFVIAWFNKMLSAKRLPADVLAAISDRLEVVEGMLKRTGDKQEAVNRQRQGR